MIRAVISALRPGIPTPVLCETCGTVRARIRAQEAGVLIAQGQRGHIRQIRCRARGCDGFAIPITPADLALYNAPDTGHIRRAADYYTANGDPQ